jgi:hypothetical protein
MSDQVRTYPGSDAAFGSFFYARFYARRFS